MRQNVNFSLRPSLGTDFQLDTIHYRKFSSPMLTDDERAVCALHSMKIAKAQRIKHELFMGATVQELWLRLGKEKGWSKQNIQRYAKVLRDLQNPTPTLKRVIEFEITN